jgi:hypothetical protein
MKPGNYFRVDPKTAGFGTMGRKKDLKQVDDVAAEFGMDEAERMGFGEFLEECKTRGVRGTKNNRGISPGANSSRRRKNSLAFQTKDEEQHPQPSK